MFIHILTIVTTLCSSSAMRLVQP